MSQFFVIEVTKHGGATGYGRSMLKADGEVVKFEERDHADTAADDYRRQMNTPHATALYDAEVVEVGTAAVAVEDLLNVECGNCKRSFNHAELVNAITDRTDADNKVCPHCHSEQWALAELET